MKKYLVVYEYETKCIQHGKGNVDISIDVGGLTIEAIRKVEEMVKTDGDYSNVVVLNVVPIN